MGSGGARKGAGRPKGQGKYKEPTKPVRIPESMITDVMKYLSVKGYRLPLYASTVQAGFPSPADDYIEEQLDLNKHLIKLSMKSIDCYLIIDYEVINRSMNQ